MFGRVVRLSSLDGTNGFQISGEAESNASDRLVSSAGAGAFLFSWRERGQASARTPRGP